MSGVVHSWHPSLFHLTSALLADLEQTLQCTTELKQKDRAVLFLRQDPALHTREDSLLSALTSAHMSAGHATVPHRQPETYLV
jgi:hypothetical protein